MMFGLILLVIVAFYLSNSSNCEAVSNVNHQSPIQTATDILNERYALGEIDREEYVERKLVLSGQKQSISIKKG